MYITPQTKTMKYNFTIRLYKDEALFALSSLSNIVLSDICILSKPAKFGNVCTHSGSQKKLGYSVSLSKTFRKIAGSHSSPSLAFDGDFIDIQVKGFPRYPVTTQDNHVAISLLNTDWAGRLSEDGNYVSSNHVNNGFPNQLKYRRLDIIFDSGEILHLGKKP